MAMVGQEIEWDIPAVVATIDTDETMAVLSACNCLIRWNENGTLYMRIERWVPHVSMFLVEFRSSYVVHALTQNASNLCFQLIDTLDVTRYFHYNQKTCSIRYSPFCVIDHGATAWKW